MIRDVDVQVPASEKERALGRLARARTACDLAADAPMSIQAIATDRLLDAEALCQELGAKETA